MTMRWLLSAVAFLVLIPPCFAQPPQPIKLPTIDTKSAATDVNQNFKTLETALNKVRSEVVLLAQPQIIQHGVGPVTVAGTNTLVLSRPINLAAGGAWSMYLITTATVPANVKLQLRVNGDIDPTSFGTSAGPVLYRAQRKADNGGLQVVEILATCTSGCPITIPTAELFAIAWRIPALD